MKQHIKIDIQGYVQGVGFRPFIFRLARDHEQFGWIANTGTGVTLAIEGEAARQQAFLTELQNGLPPLAEIKDLQISAQPLAGYTDFRIKDSAQSTEVSVFVLPDIATCPACLEDISNPVSRYYHYPFTSCCYCGPRYSIMQRQPYDRDTTTMAEFQFCADCALEYQTPENRRFHAQTIACPACGPQVSLVNVAGAVLAEKYPAIQMAAACLQMGKVVALKAIGGYQLLVDAGNETAIEVLRQRKHRPQKPFALMAANLDAAAELAFITPLEASALSSAAAPIVLLNRRSHLPIADAVAPEQSLLGIMLPNSPLHYLLLKEFPRPVVATSGNRQDEPICIDNDQALTQLAGIADVFLIHNRQILRPLDDSIVRLLGGKITSLRRARGYVPVPITLKKPIPDTLALGGQLKNTVAVGSGRHVIVSQHLGDLEASATQRQMQLTLADLQRFYQLKPPVRVMHDLHADYSSSQFALKTGLKTSAVQHHYAHSLSCMAEHGLEPPLLSIAWDGTGLGTDQTLWGGEFLLIEDKGYRRFAHFAPFSLPGGAVAIKEPRRSALGLLYEIAGEQAFTNPDLAFNEQELSLLQLALSRGINTPRTTSVGRLFDGVASLLGLCQRNAYQGHAAMLLESAALAGACLNSYLFSPQGVEPVVIDWKITIEQLLADRPHYPPEIIAAKFHNTLIEIMSFIATQAHQNTVILTGGCFQNAYLVARACEKLTAAGLKVYTHEQIPPNDGGLALGQLVAAENLT